MRFLAAWLAACAALVIPGPGRAPAGRDTTPPVLVSLDFAPRSIETATGDQLVTIVVRFADDLSGIDTDAPGVPCSFAGARQVACGRWRLVSGDRLEGVLHAGALFPAFSPAGQYRLVNLLLVDRRDNSLLVEDPGELGFDTVLVNDPLRGVRIARGTETGSFRTSPLGAPLLP